MAEKDIIFKGVPEGQQAFCDFVNGALAQGRPLLKKEGSLSRCRQSWYW